MTFGTWRWWGCQPHAPAAFTPRKFSWYSFHTRGWVDSRVMLRSVGMSLKNTVTPPGMDPGAVRPVAQHLNHYATPGPSFLSFPFVCIWKNGQRGARGISKRRSFIETLCHLFEQAAEYIITGKWVSNIQSCRSQWPRGLRRRFRPLACWECGFESHRRHGCLSVVIVVCCQVQISATSWSLVQRSPTDCGA